MEMNLGGPYSPVGSAVNVIVCAAGIGFGIWFGFAESPAGFFIAGVAALLEIVFLRTAIRVHRDGWNGPE